MFKLTKKEKNAFKKKRREKLHKCIQVMISCIEIPKKYISMHIATRANKLVSLCSHYERLKYKHRTIAFLYSRNGPFEYAIRPQ